MVQTCQPTMNYGRSLIESTQKHIRHSYSRALKCNNADFIFDSCMTYMNKHLKPVKYKNP